MIKSIFNFMLLLIPLIGFSQRAKLYTGLPNKDYYKNGSVRIEREFKDYKLLGYKTFFKSGQLRSNYVFNEKGQHDSIANFYFPNGNIKTIWEYKKGRLKNRTDFTLNGKIITGKADYERLRGYYKNSNSYDLGTFFHRGRTNSKLGYYDESLEDYNLFLSKVSPQRLKYWAEKSLYHYLGRNYAAIEDYKKALEYNFKALLTRRSDRKPQILNNLGQLFFKTKEYDQAMKYTDQSIALDPNAYFAFFSKAKIYLALGDLNKAFNFIQKTIAHDKSHKISAKNIGDENTIWATRGEIYYKLGKYEEALKENPVNSYALRYLATTYLKLNKPNKACEALIKAEKYKYDEIYESNDVKDLINKHCSSN